VVQWLVGLERLGHDVLFINTVAEMPPEDEIKAASYFESTMARWWHIDQSALFNPTTRKKWTVLWPVLKPVKRTLITPFDSLTNC
jgi:hypothetical protein